MIRTRHQLLHLRTWNGMNWALFLWYTHLGFRWCQESQNIREPDVSYRLDVTMGMAEDMSTYFLINNVSYKEPLVPTLLTVLSAPSDIVNLAEIYGHSTNSIVLQPRQTIQLIVNNLDMEEHPCASQTSFLRNINSISSPPWSCFPSASSRSW